MPYKKTSQVQISGWDRLLALSWKMYVSSGASLLIITIINLITLMYTILFIILQYFIQKDRSEPLQISLPSSLALFKRGRGPSLRRNPRISEAKRSVCAPWSAQWSESFFFSKSFPPTHTLLLSF